VTAGIFKRVRMPSYGANDPFSALPVKYVSASSSEACCFELISLQQHCQRHLKGRSKKSTISLECTHTAGPVPCHIHQFSCTCHCFTPYAFVVICRFYSELPEESMEAFSRPLAICSVIREYLLAGN